MGMSSTDDLLSQQFNARNGCRLLKTRKTLRHRTTRRRKTRQNGKVTFSFEEQKRNTFDRSHPIFPVSPTT
jgi:hypothetical protein